MHQEAPRPGFERVDPEKRATLRRLAAGAAFVAPVVLSFPLSGLSISDARAYVDTGDDRADLLPIPGDPSEDSMLGRNRQGNAVLPLEPGNKTGPGR